MGILGRLLGRTAASGEPGLHMDEPECWEVSGTRDVERFLRALLILAPEKATVYFEGTAEPHIAECLRAVAIPPPVRIAVGTMWPRPDWYHVPLTAERMQRIASVLEAHPAGYFCSHLHVHDGSAILLQWHDAFGHDPMLVSRSVGEEAVKTFAAAIGSSYRPGTD